MRVSVCTCVWVCVGVVTVDDSEDAPEKEDDEEGDRFFPFRSTDAFDKDKVQGERCDDDDAIE